MIHGFLIPVTIRNYNLHPAYLYKALILQAHQGFGWFLAQ